MSQPQPIELSDKDNYSLARHVAYARQLDSAENSIRPFAVGRRRWMFCDTPAGAHASAVIYSRIETARANGLEPYTWLRRVLRELPAAQSVEAIEALLPWSLHRQDLASEMTP
ncbi:transposase [Paraburkholderia sp. 5N]|uniref:Transposase n=1 Tax=Paraburkholderia elongata TaxID=2675747 RepID=A0A972SKP9_9BURK|nr:transposase [Paraburkholderia elongata]